MTVTYLQRMRLIRRDAWLAMTAQLTFGFSQRGAFAVLFNLYLLRLGYDARFIGLVNAVWLLTFAVLAVPGGLLARRWGPRRLMAVSYLLFSIAYGPILTFMNLYLNTQLQTPPALVGGVLAGARLLSLPAGLAAPLLAARWGRLRGNTLGLGILAVGLALLLVAPHWLAVGIAYATALAAFMLTSSVGQVYGQEVVAPEWRGAIAGASSLALGLGLGSVALVGGYLISAWGYPTLFALAGAASLGGALLFWGYFRRPRGELAGRLKDLAQNT